MIQYTFKVFFMNGQTATKYIMSKNEDSAYQKVYDSWYAMPIARVKLLHTISPVQK